MAKKAQEKPAADAGDQQSEGPVNFYQARPRPSKAEAGFRIEEDEVKSPGAKAFFSSPPVSYYKVSLEGTLPILFNRYSVTKVAAVQATPKGSKERKGNDVESCLYRDEEGRIVVPAISLNACFARSARDFKDPSSPRRMASDLFKSSIRVDGEFVPFTRDGNYITTPEMEHSCGAVVSHARINRVRPGLAKGWRLEFVVANLMPTLIDLQLAGSVFVNAGLRYGLCDYRPNYGTFQVTRCENHELE